MEIESNIRSRIETILLHDARRYADLKHELGEEDLPWLDPSEQERGLYDRIITSCRSAVAEVNSLLEENIEFLSGFYRIVEGIKEKRDLEEICVQIATCALQDFRAEYCGIILFEDASCDRDRFCLEAVSEEQTMLRMHSRRPLLGSAEFEEALTRALNEGGAHLDSPDVYRDPRFANIDFPSVIRSLACVPVVLHGRAVGALVLAHSIASSFQENHFRILKIVAGLIAHVRLLTCGDCAGTEAQGTSVADVPGQFSVLLLSFESCDAYGRLSTPDSATLREICRSVASALERSEPMLPHGETEFIAVLPGIGEDAVSAKVRKLRDAFRSWRAGGSNGRRSVRMNVGFSTCHAGENLSRLLEVASALMQPETDE